MIMLEVGLVILDSLVHSRKRTQPGDNFLEPVYHKIDLFQQTVGELSTILTRLEETGTNFEDEIFERLVHADSEVELENDFDRMAIDLEQQQDLSQKVEQFNSGVFESFDLGASDD